MSRSLVLSVLVLNELVGVAAGAIGETPDYGRLPLDFEENRGQTDTSVRFLARGEKYSVFVTEAKAVFVVKGSAKSAAISMQVAGARAGRIAEPQDPLPGCSNYFIGNDPAKWRRGIRHFGKVRVAGVKKGVDLIYHGSGSDLEYDLVLAPGASASGLRLHFDGASSLTVDSSGDLLIHSEAGDLRQRHPEAWQESGGVRRAVQVSQVLSGPTDVILKFGVYDRARPLTIDPVVLYSTYLGGSGVDTPAGIAVDASGNAYVTGNTSSMDFPVTSGSYAGNSDAFIAKLNSSGTALLYAVYIGGSNQEYGSAIAVDTSGNAFITGYTWSSNFPIVFSGSSSCPNAPCGFVTGVNSSGVIIASRYLGGAGSQGNAVAVDSGGNPYVTGTTGSGVFPVTVGSLITTKPANSSTGFVTKLDPTLGISYGTYLGGSNTDSPVAIAVDSSGNAFVAGVTNSSNFPITLGAFQTAYKGSGDAFVTELNPQGSALVYSTFLGGSNNDGAVGLALDAAGSVYVIGATQSNDFPTTPGAFLTSKPGFTSSPFVTKVNPGGATLAYSTYLGGSGGDFPKDLVVDASGNAYLLGTAQSSNFPTTPGAIKTQRSYTTCCSDNSDLFISELNSTGATLVYSTYLGTSSSDTAAGIAIDSNLGVYVAGYTQSLVLPTTPAAFQPNSRTSGSLNTGFVVKIDFSSPAICNIALSSNSANFPGRGGAGSFTFTAASGCPWEVTNDFIINVTSARSGFGNGTVNFTVAQNQSTFSTQTGTIHVNGGVLTAGTNTFTVNQAAGSCTDPVFNPPSLNFAQAGGIQNISVSLPQGCGWNLANVPPWITPSNNVSSNGSGNLSLFAGSNSFSARATTITLASKAFSVTQAAGSCTLSLTSSSASVVAQAVAGSAAFTTGSTCVWQAGSLVPWIQIPSNSSTGQGSGSISYVVAANPGIAPRTGAILIGDKLFQITQNGGPGYIPLSYTSSPYSSGFGFSGDGGAISSASVASPAQMAFDNVGNLYFADSGNGRIRKIDVNGIITTVAGGGTGALGDGGPAISATLQTPTGVAVDTSGNIYITDNGHYRVRKVTNNVITTIAGTGTAGYNGDNQPASSALVNWPSSVAVDGAGNVYFSDSNNNRIRKITPGGVILTLAGNGSNGFSGDGGPATAAQIGQPMTVVFDSSGNLVFLDYSNSRVRRISTAGIINTVAGGGNSINDGVPATSASLSFPLSIGIDAPGSIYIGGSNGGIRKVIPDGTIWTISTYANGYGTNGLAVDSTGAIYSGNYTALFRWTPTTTFCTYSASQPSQQLAAGGNLMIAVTATTSSCPWSASSNISWITVQTANSSGSGSANYTLARNTSTFPRSGTITVAGQTISIVQAPAVVPDFAASGKAGVFLYDPVVGNAYTGLSNGTSGFNFVYSPATPSFDTIRYGDVNSDGKTDLILYNSSNALGYTLIGNGNGTFAGVSLFWGPGFNRVAAGDLNGDGKTDFMIYRPSDGTSYAVISNGDATFHYKYTLVSPGFTHMQVADFNGDGQADVFYYNSSSGAAFLGIGDGNGGFTFSPVTLPAGYSFVEAGDFNGDGKADLLFYASSTGTSTIAVSTGATFSFTTNFWTPGFTSVKLLDVNGDGFADIVLYNKNNALAYLLVGDGVGAFAGYSLFWGPGFDNVQIVDLNGDGKQDVIIYNSTNAASYTGISTGNPNSPFTYQYSFWGTGRSLGTGVAQP